MRIISVEDDTVNDPCMITPFFIVHLLAGIWLTSLLKTFFPSIKNVLLWVVLLHTVYEIKDMYVNYILKYNTIYTNSSWWNSIGDTIAVIIGYYAYQQLPLPLSFTFITVLFALVSAIGWGTVVLIDKSSKT